MARTETMLNDSYEELVAAIAGLLDGEQDYIANAANLSALVFDRLDDVNWVGFYFMRGGELVVGPFCGLPACTRIAVGRGVCGTAVARRQTLVVENVQAFDGHIPCDPISRSEVVVPLELDGEVIGVFDIDSPSAARFGDDDRVGLEAIANVYLRSLPAQFVVPA
ncbi:MAG: GAF domain-containing protein [Gammaproteobacteria bacterium]|nr:GAF domain-containing protein [Gammaproteobacteria bacterium]